MIGWKIPKIVNRKYIGNTSSFGWWSFHCAVSFRGSNCQGKVSRDYFFCQWVTSFKVSHFFKHCPSVSWSTCYPKKWVTLFIFYFTPTKIQLCNSSISWTWIWLMILGGKDSPPNLNTYGPCGIKWYNAYKLKYNIYVFYIVYNYVIMYICVNAVSFIAILVAMFSLHEWWYFNMFQARYFDVEVRAMVGAVAGTMGALSAGEIFSHDQAVPVDTVDGRNPAPVEVGSLSPIIYDGFFTSQVVQDFFHQQ